MIDVPRYAPTYRPEKRVTRSTPADGRESGFTVVEILVVIGIVAVLMSILVLGIRQASDSFALRRAGSIALSEVRRAQTQALAEREDFTVEFVIDNPGRLQIYRGSTLVRAVQGPEEWPASVALEDEGPPSPPANTDWLPPCTGPGDPLNNKCVKFKFMGAPEAVAVGSPPEPNGAVRLRSRSGNWLWLTITTGTGKVSVRR